MTIVNRLGQDLEVEGDTVLDGDLLVLGTATFKGPIISGPGSTLSALAEITYVSYNDPSGIWLTAPADEIWHIEAVTYVEQVVWNGLGASLLIGNQGDAAGFLDVSGANLIGDYGNTASERGNDLWDAGPPGSPKIHTVSPGASVLIGVTGGAGATSGRGILVLLGWRTVLP